MIFFTSICTYHDQLGNIGKVEKDGEGSAGQDDCSVPELVDPGGVHDGHQLDHVGGVEGAHSSEEAKPRHLNDEHHHQVRKWPIERPHHRPH